MLGLNKIGKGIRLGRHVRLRNRSKISIGSGTWIDDLAYLNGASEKGLRIGAMCQIRYAVYLDCWNGVGIEIGDKTFIGPFTVIQGQGGTMIGSGCLIAGHCYIVPSNHIFSNPDIPIKEQGETQQGITIEDDVWVGAGTVILDAVRVGRGSIIGAGSVVTKSIPEQTVAFGVPAKPVRKRI